MIDEETADRIRCVLEGIPGVEGFAVVLDFGAESSMYIRGTDPEQAAYHLKSVAAEYRRQVQTEAEQFPRAL